MFGKAARKTNALLAENSVWYVYTLAGNEIAIDKS